MYILYVYTCIYIYVYSMSMYVYVTCVLVRLQPLLNKQSQKTSEQTDVCVYMIAIVSMYILHMYICRCLCVQRGCGDRIGAERIGLGLVVGAPAFLHTATTSSWISTWNPAICATPSPGWKSTAEGPTVGMSLLRA